MRAIIEQTCDILVKEGDSLLKLICRNCKKLDIKMSEFRQKCQSMQVGMEQSCSVKRCVELSPSSQQPPKQVPASSHATPDAGTSCPAKKSLFTCKRTTTSASMPPESFLLLDERESLLNDA